MADLDLCPNCRQALLDAIARDGFVRLGDGVTLRRSHGLEGTVLAQDEDIFSTGEQWDADRDGPD